MNAYEQYRADFRQWMQYRADEILEEQRLGFRPLTQAEVDEIVGVTPWDAQP